MDDYSRAGDDNRTGGDNHRGRRDEQHLWRGNRTNGRANNDWGGNRRTGDNYNSGEKGDSWLNETAPCADAKANRSDDLSGNAQQANLEEDSYEEEALDVGFLNIDTIELFFSESSYQFRPPTVQFSHKKPLPERIQ